MHKNIFLESFQRKQPEKDHRLGYTCIICDKVIQNFSQHGWLRACIAWYHYVNLNTKCWYWGRGGKGEREQDSQGNIRGLICASNSFMAVVLNEAWVHGCLNTLFCEIFYSRSDKEYFIRYFKNTLPISESIPLLFSQWPSEYFYPCRQCLLVQNTVSIQGKNIKGLGLNSKYKWELPSQSPAEVAAREATPAWAKSQQLSQRQGDCPALLLAAPSWRSRKHKEQCLGHKQHSDNAQHC